MNKAETTLHEILTALRNDRSAVIPHQEFDNELDSTQCVLCRLSSRSVRRALRDIFAEFVNDPPLRIRLRKSRGFCAGHVPLLSGSGEALGVAILCHDLVDETLKRWSENIQTVENRFSAVNVNLNREGIPTRQSLPRNGFFSFLNFGSKRESLKKEPCPLCNAFTESEKRYVEALAEGLKREEVWEALQTGGRLCVRHVENLASRSRKEIGIRLISSEADRLKALQIELEEFIRKNDYRFRDEAMGTENDSWRRALTTLNS